MKSPQLRLARTLLVLGGGICLVAAVLGIGFGADVAAHGRLGLILIIIGAALAAAVEPEPCGLPHFHPQRRHS